MDANSDHAQKGQVFLEMIGLATFLAGILLAIGLVFSKSDKAIKKFQFRENYERKI